MDVDDATLSLVNAAVDRGYANLLDRGGAIGPTSSSPTQLQALANPPAIRSVITDSGAEAMKRYGAAVPDISHNDPIVIQKTLLPSGPVSSANAVQNLAIATGGPVARGATPEYLTYDQSLSWGEVAMYFVGGLAVAYVIDRYV